MHARWFLIAVALTAGCAAAAGPKVAPVPPAAIVATVPAGGAPILLALSPDGRTLYAASNDGKLTIIDTSSPAVAETLDVPPYASGIVAAPSGGRVYVATLFGDGLLVLDTATNTLAKPLGLISHLRRGGYSRIAVAPDGSTAYIANETNRMLARLDLATGALWPMTPDMSPVDVALTPDGGRLLIAGCKNLCVPGAVLPFTPATQDFGPYSYVGSRPYRILVSPDGRRAYLANLGASSVSVIDAATLEQVAEVPVPPTPTGLALSADGRRLFVASQDTGALAIVDTVAAQVLAAVRVGKRAREVAVSPDGRRAYVSTADGIVVVDTAALLGAGS